MATKTTTKTKTKKDTTPRYPMYERCPVYWCRFYTGGYCSFRRDDTMKNTVCIKDEATVFYKKTVKSPKKDK